MSLDKPLSISTGQMADEVKKAVDAALGKHQLQNAKISEGLGVSHGIVGFVMTPHDLGDKSVSDVSQIASDVANTLKAGDPAAVIRGGHIIVGFMPSSGIASFTK